MKVLYLDESGNHNLNEVNPDYPLFVLGGVLADYRYSMTTVETRIAEFKRHHFSNDQIVLHAREMFRPKPDGKFAFLADQSARIPFYDELSRIISDFDIRIMAGVIFKADHVTRYGARARDPYDYALDIVVERFCRELISEDEAGLIYAEKRNSGADGTLMKRWRHLRENGTYYADAADIRARIAELILVDKRPNIACMQIADLAVSVIGRWQAGKVATNQELSREVVISKLCRQGGRYSGVGLTVRPKQNERPGTA